MEGRKVKEGEGGGEKEGWGWWGEEEGGRGVNSEYLVAGGCHYSSAQNKEEDFIPRSQ